MPLPLLVQSALLPVGQQGWLAQASVRLSSTMLLGGGANMCVTTSPGFSRGMSLDSGETVWPIWIMTGRLKAVATSCARRRT